MKVMVNTLPKTLSVTDFLDEIRQHLTNVIKKLKSAGFSWKMTFIWVLHYYYEKFDKVNEKEMFVWGAYGVIKLEINTHTFIEEIFKLVE